MHKTRGEQLSTVERAFRSIKTIDLHVRPINHYKAERVRAHVLLCMLAYYVEWHMREALAPILFADDDRPEAQALRASIVAPAQRSKRARRKDATKLTDDGVPVHSFRSLLGDLATIAKNRVHLKQPANAASFDVVTTPTPLQQRAYDLLGVTLRAYPPSNNPPTTCSVLGVIAVHTDSRAETTTYASRAQEVRLRRYGPPAKSWTLVRCGREIPPTRRVAPA